MHKEIIKFIATGQLFFSALSALAEQPSDSLPTDLKEVTVIATRTERNILETGRSITVLTQNELQSGVYSTVAELLSNQEGIYITGNNQTPGALESIFMRGSNSNQTAIFLDGIRINDGSTANNTIDLSELPLSDVVRIEILRGSQGTLYGSSAIGGVILISTFRPLQKGKSGSFSVSAGTFNKSGSVLFPAASVGYRFKNGVSLSAAGNFQSVRGLDATLDTVLDPTVFKNRDRDNWAKAGVSGLLAYEWSKGAGTINFRHVKMNTDIDKSAYLDDDNYTLDYERNTIHGNFRYSFLEKLEAILEGGFTKNIRHANNDSSVTNLAGTTDHTFSEDHYSSANVNADFYVRFKEKSISAFAGYSIQKENMNQANYYYSALFAPFITEINTSLDSLDPSASIGSLYAQVDINGEVLHKSMHTFNLILGARTIQHSKFGNKFIWEINPSWSLSLKSLLYFSFSKGFNSPSLYQLYAPDQYYTYDNNFSSGLSRGNPDLLPEVSDSYELGLKQKIDDSGFFGIAVFKSITKNLIDYVYLWDSSIPTDQLGTDFSRDDFRGDRYLNTGKQTTYGIEFTIENRMTDFLKVHFNLSLVNGYLDYKESNNFQAQAGGNHVQEYNNGAFLTGAIRTQGLTRRPNTARIDFILFPMKKMSSTIGLSYIGPRGDVYYDAGKGPFGALSTTPVNDYTLLDFSLHYSLTSSLSAVLKVENLLNEHYSEINGFRTRGRGLYLKLGYVL
ncbi:MAG TPA: TonB-dependent receptor [Bacteroidia bacterium]|nr:TonB-dependent receptor [Bacteroidia bacterium]